jgi:hypothetical protein
METPTLLGYLARFGSFSVQSELLCTQGLTYLLQTYEDARSAMAKVVGDCTGIVINPSLIWRAEFAQEDRGKPDLEACSADGIPVVKVEAKLAATLFESQVKSYVEDLKKRNNVASTMLVLVPERRITEAANVIASALKLSGSGPWRVTDGHGPGIAVISWEQIFDAFRGGKAESFRHELGQLRAMYRVLSGSFIAPLADDEDLLRWRERETDFVNVVDEVTRRLTRLITTQRRVYPMQLEPLEGVSLDSDSSGYRFRYVCPFDKSCFSIGVRDSFAMWNTPVWMRFHQDTDNFRRIRQRIEASNVRSLESGGHIWIPLDVPLEVSGEPMTKSLVHQAGEIVRIAYDSNDGAA